MVAVDLIEHVEEPSLTLAEISRVLAAKGMFLGICPNWGAFSQFGKRWIGVHSNYEHLSYFTAEVLSKMAAKHGLVLNVTQYQGMPLKRMSYTLKQPILAKFFEPWKFVYNLLSKWSAKMGGEQSLHEFGFVFEKSGVKTSN